MTDTSDVERPSRPTVVFLDRDGTIIEDVHYLSRPEQVHLIPGAAQAIVRINHAGIPVVLVTNQSGIARGYFTVDDYERAHARLVALLADEGAHLDGAYYCPHLPEHSGPCSCRKPSSLLFRQAIAELALDGSHPVFIGDKWRDLQPMHELGGAGYLIPSGDTSEEDVDRARAEANVVPSITDAVDLALGRQ